MHNTLMAALSILARSQQQQQKRRGRGAKLSSKIVTKRGDDSCALRSAAEVAMNNELGCDKTHDFAQSLWGPLQPPDHSLLPCSVFATGYCAAARTTTAVQCSVFATGYVTAACATIERRRGKTNRTHPVVFVKTCKCRTPKLHHVC